MRRALLLVNSGARNAADERSGLAAALERHAIQVLETSEPDPAHFGELIDRFGDKVDLICVAGGDGTCLSVAAKVRERNLPLGVLPLGTANNLARSLGIPASVEEAARIIGEGHERRIDLGLVNGRPFLNVSGMGLSTQVNRKVPAELKKRWGALAYIIYLFKVIRRTTPFRAEITCDGKTTRVRSLQITVCNGRHYGSGLTIAEDASIQDRRLDLLSTNLGRWWQGLRLLPAMMKGRYPKSAEVHVTSGSHIEIKTSPRMSLDTDGEVTTRTPALYEVIPGALRVFAPA